MTRRHHTLAWVAVLVSAPVLSLGVAAAEPAGMADRATSADTAEAQRLNREGSSDAPAGTAARIPPVPQVDSNTPSTPVPLNLPDEATTSEVKGEYGIGIAGLIFGTVLIAAIVVGLFYVISRRNWSTSH